MKAQKMYPVDEFKSIDVKTSRKNHSELCKKWQEKRIENITFGLEKSGIIVGWYGLPAW